MTKLPFPKIYKKIMILSEKKFKSVANQEKTIFDIKVKVANNSIKNYF